MTATESKNEISIRPKGFTESYFSFILKSKCQINHSFNFLWIKWSFTVFHLHRPHFSIQSPNCKNFNPWLNTVLIVSFNFLALPNKTISQISFFKSFFQLHISIQQLPLHCNAHNPLLYHRVSPHPTEAIWFIDIKSILHTLPNTDAYICSSSNFIFTGGSYCVRPAES